MSDQLTVVYANPENLFMAGYSVVGTVVLTAHKMIRVKQLYIEVKCDANTGWVNKASDKIYESSENYMTEKIDMGVVNVTLPPGKHGYPFRCAIGTNCPSSFEGEYGSVRYATRVVLATSEDPSVTLVVPFTVLARVNLGNMPSAKRPIEAKDNTDFTCCCVPFGRVKTTINLPRSGFLIGEEVPIRMRISNESRTKIDMCRFMFVITARSRARSRYENAEDTKLREYIIEQKDAPSVPPRCVRLIDDCTLKIPSKAVPTFEGRIIGLTYLLRFTANPGIEVEIPIIIATSDTEERHQILSDEGFDEGIQEDTSIVYC
uniref:Arrestin C-terminal-like domain-containing protein n=1 Tax=Plectus sambesii TaxID=2011161 RepID=A0A914V579_9BILA